MLLSLGANPNSLSERNYTPLHLLFRIFNKDPLAASKITKILLYNHADPNFNDEDKFTALHWATFKGQDKAIK